MTARVGLALVLVFAAAAGAGRAAEKPEFGADITVVSLPVFVTDGAGRAVAGLGSEDFEVTDEGRPVKVVGFRELDAADPGLADEIAEAPAARRQFLLLFDLSFSGVNGLVRARQAALDFVDRGLQPLDLAAVATFSANHGVRSLVGFTSDRFQLHRAISSLGLRQLDRRADPLGLVYDLTEVGAAAADSTLEEARSINFEDTARQLQVRYQQAERQSYRQRVMALVEGLGQLARALDGLQGRKQVVFLSSGFDATALTGEQGQRATESSEALARGRFWEVRSDDRYGDTGIRSEMEDALRAFSTSDALVHAVDLSGLSARGDPRFTGREPGRGSGQDSLAAIADLSGGRLFKNTNDVGVALREVLEMSRHYYLLAFEPREAKRPGRFHKLKVRVKGKGRGVSHRSGYFERQPFAERPALTRGFEAAEVIAKGITGGEIALRALAVPYRNAAGRVTLPVVLEVEGASLLGGREAGSLGLELYGYALAEDGTIQDLLALSVNLSMAQVGAKIRERGLQCHATFTLPTGSHSLRFLVRDADTGRSGSYRLDVTLPPFEREHVLLFPPLFMDERERWVVLEVPSRSTRDAAETPFQVAGTTFAPRTRPRLANHRTESVCVLAYDGSSRYDPASSYDIKAQLLDSGGAPVSVGRFQVAKAEGDPGGFRRFVLSFTPTDVAPGDYTLRVRLGDPASGRVSEAFQAVSVE